MLASGLRRETSQLDVPTRNELSFLNSCAGLLPDQLRFGWEHFLSSFIFALCPGHACLWSYGL